MTDLQNKSDTTSAENRTPKTENRYLVTSGLPYANGKLHIGHLAGAYLPADIYVRFLRLNGEDVIYICGTDEHGAPISIRAEAENKTPQEIVDYFHKSIKASFDAVDIEFDNFSGTARPAHHKLSQEFFLNLLNNNKITTHNTQQSYCEHCKRFLPDRYVEGECPHCHTAGARGDQCDACGKLIDATLLINPQCKLCGKTPVIKDTIHWFLDLPAFADDLKDWLNNKPNWKDLVRNYMLGWIEDGLIERSITRDIDWGVPVPLTEAQNKVLYVWFDAPIGYISSTIEWAEKIGKPDKWKDYWLDKDTKIIHFIGKDNIPFHAIIWPAMLMGQSRGTVFGVRCSEDKADTPENRKPKTENRYILPYDIPANEYLTLEGEKISTSRDWAIWVEDFVQYFDGDLLRFTLAANAPETRDADFSFKDFQNQVNNTLANVLGNLANRVFAFAKKNFNGSVRCPVTSDQTFIKTIHTACPEIHSAYSEFKVRKAVKLILDLAREGNKYFDEQKPWAVIKEDPAQAETTLFNCAELLRVISILLYPIMPKSMLKMRKMMGFEDLRGQTSDLKDLKTAFHWSDIPKTPASFSIGEIEPLFKKIDDKEIENQIAMLYARVK